MMTDLLYRQWNTVVERPCFWRWATLCMSPLNYRAMMRSNRMKVCCKLFLSPSYDDLFDFKFVKDHSMSHYVRTVFQFIRDNREKLALKGLIVRENMEKVAPYMLAQVIAQMEEVTISYSYFTPAQMETLFKKIFVYNNLKLSRLNLSDENDYYNVPCICSYSLRMVDPEIFAEAILRLEVMTLTRTRTTNNQTEELFHRIIETKSKNLKTLHVNFCVLMLQEITASMLATAFVRLEKLDISRKSLVRFHQLHRLFREIINCDDKELVLKDINLKDTQLGFLEPDLISGALLRLETVNISNTQANDKQLIHLVQSIADAKEQKITSLDLSENTLTRVPPEPLSTVVCSIPVVNLSKSKLTKVQLNCLFENIAVSKNLKLRELIIENCNLYSVDYDNLAHALARLKCFRIKKSELTSYQKIKIERGLERVSCEAS